MGRREDKRAATRSALIGAGAQVFMESGYAGASLEEIAERAGLTRGAVHYNFADKRELLFAVLTTTLRSSMPSPPTDEAPAPTLVEALRRLGVESFSHLNGSREQRQSLALGSELVSLILRDTDGFACLAIPRRLDEVLLAEGLVRLARALGEDDGRTMRGVAAGILALTLAITQTLVLDPDAWPEDLRGAAFAALVALPDPPPSAPATGLLEADSTPVERWPALEEHLLGSHVHAHDGDAVLLATPVGLIGLGDALAPLLRADLTTTVCIVTQPKSPELARLFTTGIDEALAILRLLVPAAQWPPVRLVISADEEPTAALAGLDLVTLMLVDGRSIQRGVGRSGAAAVAQAAAGRTVQPGHA